MRHLILLLFPLLMSSCMGTRYSYTFELQGENVIEKNKFSDGNIIANFKVTEKDFTVNLTNNTMQGAKLDWYESSITLFGKAESILNASKNYVYSGSERVVNVIPPNCFLISSIVPNNNFKYKVGTKYTSSGWEKVPMVEIWDLGRSKIKQRILANKGKIVGLYLPIEVGGEKKEYFFKFMITDVKKYSPSFKSVNEKATE